MKISGLVKSSLIDYPGKVAAVVFTQGCNFRCGFCHNPDLIPANSNNLISEQEVVEFLNKRRGILDGVVITGGEPTVQPDLLDYVMMLKDMGYLVKLDTNGSNPKLIEEVLKANLVDYIAMDIKGPDYKYNDICGYKNTNIIQKSIELILRSKVDYEFRTTILPYYHELDDFVTIGKMISGANKYTLQGFRPEITLDPSLSEASKFAHSQFEEISRLLEPYVKNVVIHDNI